MENTAITIHKNAANCSAIWGLFQIMGFNYAACKCSTIDEFVTKMCTSEGAQLDLFVALIKHNKWDNYLKTLNWTEFARNYNSSRFAKNKYDIKQHAYLQYK